MQQFVNSFSGGLDRDTAPTKYSNVHYFNLENFRLVTADSDGMSSESLVNTKGTVASFSFPNTNETVLGWGILREYLILITTSTETIPDRIYKLALSDLKAYSDINLSTTFYFESAHDGTGFSDQVVYDIAGTNYYDGLIYEADLELSTTSPIKDLVCNYESPTIQKIYWTDGANPLKHLNIIFDADINDLKNLDVNRLKIIPQHTYGTIDLSLATGGILKSGKVQYVYQLYSVNGGQTMFSPASGLFNITSAIYPPSDSLDFFGSELEEEANKAIEIVINLNADYSDFNRIRVVALDYQTDITPPTLRIVVESSIGSDTLYFTDFGYSIGSLALEEFQLLTNDIIPQSLTVKNNHLLAGNITTINFDVDQTYLDARAADASPSSWMEFLDTRAYRWRYASGTIPGTQQLDVTTDPTGTGNGYVISSGSSFMLSGYWNVYITVDPEGHASGLGRTFTNVDLASITNLQSSLVINVGPGSDVFSIDLTGLSSYSYATGTIHISGSGYTVAPASNYYVPSDTIYVEDMLYEYNYTAAGAATPICMVDMGEASQIIIDSGTGPDYTKVPEEHDARNYYNDISNDTDTSYEFKYAEISGLPSTSDLGGTGPLISYSFDTNSVSLGTAYESANYPLWKDDTNPEGYMNPSTASLYVGYARDEVYRFGIVFYNLVGKPSFVKWIGDIRMPNWSEHPVMSSALTADILFINFTIDWSALPDGFKDQISGVRFVRMERQEFDKTIKGSGMLNMATEFNSTSSYYSPTLFNTMANYKNGVVNPLLTVGSAIARDVVDFICPEVSFYKEMEMSPSGFVEVTGTYVASATVGGAGNVGWHTYGDGAGNQFTGYLWDNFTPITVTQTTRTNLRRVSDAWILTTPEPYDPPSHSINSLAYYNRTDRFNSGADSYRGFKGTTMLIGLDSIFSTASLPAGTGTYDTMGAVYRIPLGSSQYGGNTFENRSTATYIPCSEFIQTDTTAPFAVYGGDTFINMFSKLYAFIDSDEGGSNKSEQTYITFPVESSINISYRADRIQKYLTLTTGSAPDYTLAEFLSLGISHNPTTYPELVGDLYRYNRVYSTEDGSHQFIAQPYNFTEYDIADTAITSSEKKYLNEYSDSWLKFFFNNYITLETEYGGVTRLLTKDNRVLAFQPRGISVLSVGDREVVQSQNTQTLSIGTGGILSRFDYITTSSGASYHKGIIATELGIYYVDDINKNIRRIGQTAEPISEIKGLKAYLSDKTITDALTSYDTANREVLFHLTDSVSGRLNTISYSGFYDNFLGFYSYSPYVTIYTDKLFISSTDKSTFYKHGVGQYAVYHGATVAPSTITLVINPAQINVMRFDLLEWITLVTNSAGVEQINNTFTSLRVYNTYQDTGIITLNSDTNLKKRLRRWRYNRLRHMSTNGGKFYTADFGRLRDTHIYVTLTYDNASNYKLQFNDIITMCEATKIR